MTLHFVRGMIYPNTNTGGMGIIWRFKWMYEMWGFAINGNADPINPGGFAQVIFPTNFTGGTSLLASGSDGYHNAVLGNQVSGDCDFFTSSSAPFTPSMAGKAITIWVPGSNSSQDSVYLISRVVSGSHLIFNCNTGGTPDPITKHPTMSARTGVYYRVSDMQAALNAGAVTNNFGSSLVFNVNGAAVNPGQGNAQGFSQVQFSTYHSNSTFIFNNPTWEDMQITFGSSGQWNGTTFTVTAASNTTPITVTTSVNHNLLSGQTVTITGVNGNWATNGSWNIAVTAPNQFTLTGSAGVGAYTNGGTVYNGFPADGYSGITNIGESTGAGYSAGQSCVNLIGDPTMLICHVREQDLFQSNKRCAIYFEVPTRLYPLSADQHPLAVMTETINTGSIFTSSSTVSYGGGWIMRTHESDTTPVRSHRLLVKALRGDGTPDVFGQNLSNPLIGYNTIAGTVPQSNGILGLPGVANQFSLARCQLRSCIFTGTHVPSYHRVGLNGNFIQIQNGICWPWDNTIQPQQLLFFGSG